MPISLSGLASSAAGAIGRHTASGTGSRLVVRGGRVYKLVPATSKIQKRRKPRATGHANKFDRILELAIIASLLKH